MALLPPLITDKQPVPILAYDLYRLSSLHHQSSVVLWGVLLKDNHLSAIRREVLGVGVRNARHWLFC